MSAVANRRALMDAVQRLIKTNAPDIDDYHAVTHALAQVMTDDVGVECTLVLRVNALGLAEAAICADPFLRKAAGKSASAAAYGDRS